LRYPRDAVHKDPPQCPPFELGKAVKMHSSSQSAKLAILGYGTPVYDAIAAAKRVSPEHIEVYDARFAKPVDGNLIQNLIEQDISILTIEDHSIIGGFGSAVVEEAFKRGCDTTRIELIGLPDHWIGHGSRGEQLEEAGIDAKCIASKATEMLNTLENAQAFVTR